MINTGRLVPTAGPAHLCCGPPQPHVPPNLHEQAHICFDNCVHYAILQAGTQDCLPDQRETQLLGNNYGLFLLTLQEAQTHKIMKGASLICVRGGLVRMLHPYL